MIGKNKNLLETLLEDTFKDSEVNIKSRNNRSFSSKRNMSPEFTVENPIRTNFTKIMGELKIVKSYKGTNNNIPPCFSIDLDDLVIDFPKNWSYFAEWSQRIQEGEEDICLYINETNDKEALIPALRKINPLNWNGLLFYCENHNFYLFFVNDHQKI